MRWLWSLLAILGVIAAILWTRGGTTRTVDNPRAEPEHVLRGTPPPEAAPAPAPVADDTPEGLEVEVNLEPPAERTRADDEVRLPITVGEPIAPPTPIEVDIAKAMAELERQLTNAPAPPAADAIEGGADPPAQADPPAEPPPAEVVDESPVPAKVEPRDDGSMLIDDRYVVRGAGTAESPYVVPWELLVSAQQAYAPRLGKKRLPESVTMFDGKVVEVTGYVAFPLLQDTSDELLAMLNMWDGCCIGIPPTPYDAIEVKLAKKAAGDERFARYGTLRGTFGVKPHLVGQWLVGLYVMDNATLDTKEFGGFGS